MSKGFGSPEEAFWRLLARSRRPRGPPPGGVPGGFGGLLGGSWERLGEFLAVIFEEMNIRSFLEASWGRLGAVLGPSWAHLGAILGDLGAILGHLGTILGDLGGS